MFGCFFEIQECCPYIYGSKFTIFTNHSSLKWLINLSDPDGRLARWAIKLQAYDYIILHKTGSKHANADFLFHFSIVALLSAVDK